MLLVEKYTNLIKHQAHHYEICEDKICAKDPGDNIIVIFATHNTNNSYIVESEHIDGFVGNKYIWADGETIENPYWSE